MEEYPQPANEEALRTERITSDTCDTAGRYLRAIGEIDLLTAEEEMDLGKRYAAGRAARHLLRAEIETPPQLHTIIQDGEQARIRLITANLRLVANIAKKCVKAYHGDISSAIQEGNIGLEHAVDKFDHTKGYKFSTSATLSIRKAILRRSAYADGETIRLPEHVRVAAVRISAYERSFEQRTGRSPSTAEISTHTGIEAHVISRIARTRTLARLEEPFSAEDSSSGSLKDYVSYPDAPSPEQASVRNDIVRRLHEALGSVDLNQKERIVLECRHGFNGCDPMTLEEVGALLQLTREGVRKIQNRAQVKLKEFLRKQGVSSSSILFS